jgi:flavin reductase (DIM6/NTAB) family NADH-FMN oxidoreductase RutF
MPKKPWNRIDLPVYSICSRRKDGRFNMHIITYASQISMKPKRYICGVFEGTQTLSNLQEDPHFVLQLLSASQYRLVDLLGKKSGKYIDKLKKLEKRKLLTEWKGFPVLKDALAVMELKTMKHFSGGDHEAFLCDVLSYSNLNEGEPLTLNVLRKHKLIRI